MRKSILLITLVLIFSTVGKAQETSGRVMDAQSYPIMAANIYFASNPNSGVVSDMDGRFSIPFTHNQDTLVISFIGYESRRIAAANLKKEGNIIILENKPLSMGEVVVWGTTPISEQFSTEKNEQFGYLHESHFASRPLESHH